MDCRLPGSWLLVPTAARCQLQVHTEGMREEPGARGEGLWRKKTGWRDCEGRRRVGGATAEGLWRKRSRGQEERDCGRFSLSAAATPPKFPQRRARGTLARDGPPPQRRARGTLPRDGPKFHAPIRAPAPATHRSCPPPPRSAASSSLETYFSASLRNAWTRVILFAAASFFFSCAPAAPDAP